MKLLLLACVLLGAAAALPGLRQRRDSSALFFDLPSNATLLLGDIQTGFDCADRPYGYYADEANYCAIYHVCLPYINFDQIVTRQFSFMCGEGTVFDQERLVCDFPEGAISCDQSSSSYRRVNEFFGRLDINFNEK
ncbi:U-scoloptoxin(01)-Cw1a-like [Panulirus ornatus]|uniref:U-scoloptoxin(01)-Cw1a-like n=1 Tax=Panulirus ornatus TaxID=150431 RepID=UPI003A85FD12